MMIGKQSWVRTQPSSSRSALRFSDRLTQCLNCDIFVDEQQHSPPWMRSECGLSEEQPCHRPPPSASSPCLAWLFRLRHLFVFCGSKASVQKHSPRPRCSRSSNSSWNARQILGPYGLGRSGKQGRDLVAISGRSGREYGQKPTDQ
jgi:hypothetical protein